jgi:hypothetical protein
LGAVFPCWTLVGQLTIDSAAAIGRKETIADRLNEPPLSIREALHVTAETFPGNHFMLRG